MRTRRAFLLALGSGAAGAAGAYVLRGAEIGSLRAQISESDTLRRRVATLSYNVASGGGVNRKLMPDPVSGRPSIALDEAFTFDRNHAICRVETNPLAFKMPTYAMGDVVIAPNTFYMAMVATTVEQFIVTTMPDGKRKVFMKGGLSCATEVAQATTRLGSRTVAEHATYEIEAIDGGPGGGKAGDSFVYTAFFDRTEAPVNFAIFGPKAPFTGELIDGEITIVDPSR